MLVAARRRAGLTQRQIAIALKLKTASGDGQSTVSGWETGANPVALAQLEAWADACGVTLDVSFVRPTTPDTDALVEAWQDLPADERDTYLQIIQARAEKARKT